VSLQRCSVLDLGSNSFHVLVADLEGHAISPVLREREMLHLGRTVATHGEVPEGERDRAVATVAHLSELARRAGATEELAVATAALRDASNGSDVIAALESAAGIPIRILDGQEEGRLAYLGVRASVAIPGEPVLVLDLGGGSLELAIGRGASTLWSISSPLGASALSATVPSGRLRKRDVAALEQRVEEELATAVWPVTEHAHDTAVAVGGTVRALARIAAARHGAWLPASVNQLTLSLDDLATLRTELSEVELDERRTIPGVQDRRADHIHVAAVVLHTALRTVGVEAVTVSDWGLREGLLLDAHGVRHVQDPAALRHTEVHRLRRTFVPTDPHPVHVRELALQLFDGTTDLHRLDEVDRELLAHAAELHAIGESVALRRQQLHGAYLVQHAELRGFSPRETALLTTLVRFHPSRDLDPAYPPTASLSKRDRERARSLLALLQLADGLDRAHDQAVAEVTVDLGTEAHATLRLAGGGLHVTDAEFARKARLFTEVTGRTVVLDDTVSA
jgi:exopolyphosphatase / guanosine-5'-triphosphate,3'-diphosphate pyrophosphatase